MAGRSELLKGILDACVMAVIREQPVYGYELSQKLQKVGLPNISDGTIYPVLLRLQKNGFIRSEIKSSTTGPNRKYYFLTEDGTQELTEITQQWLLIAQPVSELLKEVKKMSNAKKLIEENNQKRPLLTAENKKVYDDFLIYIRTDLRVAEREGEELLMDILDHILEGQQEGKTATDLFGKNPQSYADEVIAALPTEKKRDIIPYVFSIVFNSLGWFSIVFGIMFLILSKFTEIERTVSFGNLLLILIAINVTGMFGIKFIFKMVRSTLFVSKGKQKWQYLKVGIFGGGSFALILLITWLLPEFGPKLQVEWFVYVITGAVLILMSMVIRRISV